MVRTLDRAVKTGGKNAKAAPSTSSTRSRSPSNGPSDRAYSSYNSVCPRETPAWQKPITSFFQNSEKAPTLADLRSKRPSPAKDIATDTQMEAEEAQPSVAGSSKMPAANVEEIRITENRNDCEMEESVISVVAKIRPREDDDNEEPKKKRKLNVDMYSKLELLESN
ncbi:hypothetical protein PPYR_00938 [Photinus pyralis]|uniref:PCNA-associated factor n=1 Tax=Photinus pyralis TaxID=7054 RepID=A0A5N4B361_PHOPY|nr:protein phosphatase 1G-like [Photinus pyralis]XP_031358863.1 protein phosphatase 1G-like [Photinus pyralis]KAB0790772.1 hypothetical protein PPYR_15418 [Photinus pyralis]KAB0803968.1 hypothetical protein PPYR_00938 [Photinus pyralis]